MRMWRKHIVTKFWKLSKAIVIDVVVVVVHSKHIKGHKTTNTGTAAASSSVDAVALEEEDQGKYGGTFLWKRLLTTKDQRWHDNMAECVKEFLFATFCCR